MRNTLSPARSLGRPGEKPGKWMSNTQQQKGPSCFSLAQQMLPPQALKSAEALVKTRATRSHARNLVRLELKGAKEGRK